MQGRWRAATGSFRWRNWDDEYVLYHEESGDTHRLNPLGARVLQRIAETPIDARTLQADLASEFAIEDPAAVEARLTELINHQHAHGLIEHTDDFRNAGPVGAR
jgi:PqqD family protein of HPr-rel-A system